MNETTVLARKTQNGKFKDPYGKISYCPAEAQRGYTEARARDKADARRKAAEEKVRPKAQGTVKPATEARDKAEAEREAREQEKATLNPWRPQDGIYAMPGANFEDRCVKADEATIAIAERSISSGTDQCNVTFIRDEPNAVRLFVTCDRQQSNAPGSTGAIASRSSETIIFRKAGDKTILMQSSTKGEFIDSGRQLAYCGPDVQKARVEQKAGK